MADWDDLRYLLALHQAGSLARAGVMLGVDKATVGRRIEALESMLDTRLVQRLPAGYRLTDAGQRALDAALAMSQVVAELEGDVGGQNLRASGPVRVTAPAWFCRHVLIPKLPQFREANLGIELQFLTTNVVVSMPKREADIAVRNVRATERGLASRRLGDLGSALYAGRSLLDRQGRPQTREDLARYHMISYQDQLTYVAGFAWLAEIKSPVAFRASDTLALAEACVAGLGLAVLPCYVGDVEPELERVACAQTCLEPIWLIVPDDLRRQSGVWLTTQWIARLFAEGQAELAGGRVAQPGAA